MAGMNAPCPPTARILTCRAISPATSRNAAASGDSGWVTTTGRPWHDTVVDLRVDDSKEPAAALADLLVTGARYTDVVRAFEQAIDGDPVTADRELELLRPMDPATEPDQLMWRAVVAA